MKQLCFLALFLLSGGTAFAGESFIPGTADIPLMDGLTVNPVPSMDFDTPAGQILTVTAVGKKLSGQEVLSYYEKALPQMGWESVKKGHYQREGDSVILTVIKEGKPAVIRFETASLNAKE